MIGSRRSRRTERKILVDKLDDLFSVFVRLREKKRNAGRCFFGCGLIQCCFHVVTRAKHSVRWDPDNGVGSCHAANQENEYNPNRYIAAYIKIVGLATYESLVARGHRIAKFSNDDLRAIGDGLRARITAL